MLQVQQLRAERGLPTIETSHHLVFSGNPGTGKTTVAGSSARSTGRSASSRRGISSRPTVSLVPGYVGQTALKTKETLEASLGGCS
jgi:anion-transporting  ArsA/GET3 family ATPase